MKFTKLLANDAIKIHFDRQSLPCQSLRQARDGGLNTHSRVQETGFVQHDFMRH
jgi:hypothetical protein